MRFGKRLAVAIQNGLANEPYVSYKELKHTVSKFAALIGGGNDQVTDDEGSSANEDASPKYQIPASAPSTSAPSTSAGSSAAAWSDKLFAGGQSTLRLEAHQREFFARLDADIAQATMHVQSSIASLEAAMGDWQVSAIVAGLLFTPDQLNEVSSVLPCQIRDQEVLLEWLVGLQPSGCSKTIGQVLFNKYNKIAGRLNMLLQYIEVNLTAIRKILKKFEKKIPASLRIQNVCEYKTHHSLCIPSLQDLLRTAVQMYRLVSSAVVAHMAAATTSIVVPISQIGPESLSLLSRHLEPADLDALSGVIPARIDVYAKPNPANGGSNGAAGVSSRRPSTDIAGPAKSGHRLPNGGTTCHRATHAYPVVEQVQHPVLVPHTPPTGNNFGAANPTSPTPTSAARLKKPRPKPNSSMVALSVTGENRHNFDQEQETSSRGGQKCGARTNQGNRRGRKGAGRGALFTGHGQNTMEGYSDMSSFSPMPFSGANHGFTTAHESSNAVLPSYFVPVYVSSVGGYKGGQGAFPGRGGCNRGGKGGRGGRRGRVGNSHNDDSNSTSKGNMEPCLDPNLLAGALPMPMFWPPFGGMVPFDTPS